MIKRPVVPLYILLGALAGTSQAPVACFAASPAAMPVQIVPLGAFRAETDTASQPPAVSSTGAQVATSYQPAPMPDPDIDPPHGAFARGPSLTPALFSHKEEFNGDGYAGASDPDHGLDHRRTPAAGLNWSVPVR